MLNGHDQTPCGVLFSLLKTHGGISHRELADLMLSERPLPNGRTPRDLARDRSWLSRNVVHAPVGTLQQRYFCDYGSAAARVMSRLRSKRGRAMSAEDIVAVLMGEPGRAMDVALERCHEDAKLYRNALGRLAGGEGLTPGERAESALVLFVTTGCTADVRSSVAYAMDYVRTTLGRRAGTPTVGTVAPADERACASRPGLKTRLGLIRVEGGYVAGDPHWLSDSPEGVMIGSLAMGEKDITDVGPGVSGRHAIVRRDERGVWLVEDLGSKNGTALVSGATHESARLEAGSPAALRPGDELVLAGATTFVAIEGVAQ